MNSEIKRMKEAEVATYRAYEEQMSLIPTIIITDYLVKRIQSFRNDAYLSQQGLPIKQKRKVKRKAKKK